MNRRFYLRAGVGFLIATLATLYFTYDRSQAVASSFPVSSNTNSHNSNQFAAIGFNRSDVAAQPIGASSDAAPLLIPPPWPISFAGVGSPAAFQVGCSTANFVQAPTSPEPAGNNPHFIAVGYLNADSHLDIVSTNFDSASITILLGDGTGNFTILGSSIPVGLEPVTAEIGDYNNDNKQDIAVCNQNSHSVTILLGNGNGTFNTAPNSPIAVGTAPRTVVKGYFNGDSNLDLATTNGGSNNLTILLGNGNGTFTQAAGSPVAGGYAPFHAIVANLNADAFADLAVANLGGGTVSIFLGNGNGGFTRFGSDISVGSFSAYIAVGRFNADSNLDLAVCNRLSDNMVVLLGNGNGSFTQALGSPYAVGYAPMGVVAGDLNLDGVLDLAVSNENSANTTILLGNGAGGFGTPTTVNKGQLPTHLALADFNEDSKLDIATSDGGDNTITILLNTCNGCSPITVNPATISAGTVGSGYNQSFTASGGVSPYSFSLTGTLPTGLSFTGSTLSGTPTQRGSFPITVNATGSNSCTGSRNYTLVVNCQGITVNPATIPAGTIGSAYNQTFTQTGGIGATTFSLTGTLPAGITFSGGTLSGTPTQTGSFPITVTTTDSNGCTGSRSYTLVISCQTITITQTTIPTGTVSTAYSQTFTQTGGVGTTTFALTGTLPSGITFSGNTLSGTPTQRGSFLITITATDSNGCTGSANYTLIIGCQTITVNPATIPAGTAGTAYSQTFTQTGGVGTTTYSLIGTLPTGLTLSGATLSGTPTQTGSFTITVTATDANGCTGSRNYTLVINCQTITINPTTISSGGTGTAYSQSFTQSGGIGATSFSLTGTLPTGLTFSGATLSGTPTQSGSFPIVVSATDANGCTGSRNYSLLINCQSLTVNPTTIASGTINTAYSQTFSYTGGVGAVTFSLTGALPTGLTFSGSTLSGTPTQSGSFPITVSATDSNNCTGGRNYTLVINCQAISVLPATIPAGTAGTAYSQTFSTSGEVGKVTFGQSGNLPLGMTFTGSTLSGTPTQTGSFPISITATDSGGCSATFNYTLVINCQTIAVNPATIAVGTAGSAYSQVFTQSGGIGTTTFSRTGTLPAGMTFSGATLSGTPTQIGNFPITIKATDSNGCIGTTNYTLVVTCQTITINPATIAAGAAGSAYSQVFTQTGGIGTTTFSLTGTLPTGMTFTGATLSGTPTQTGSFPITVSATDANGCFGTRNYTLVINCSGITVNPATLPNGVVGNSYGTQTLTATGGVAPYTFTVSAGALPSGITLSGATLSGTPTTAGTYNFTILATAGNGCQGARAYTVTISTNGVNGLQFYPLATPVRLLDTRSGQTACFTPGAKIQSNAPRTQSAAGTCSIPAGAQVVTGHITTLQANGAGYVTLYPSNVARPNTANSNYTSSQTLNSAFTVGLGTTDGAFKIYVSSNTHVIVDITGYYAPPGAGGLYYHPLPKVIRLLETRAGQPGCFTRTTPLPGGSDTLQQGTATCSGVTIPSTALALSGIATTINPSNSGYLTLFAANITRPPTSNSNYESGQTLNAMFTVALSSAGQFKIFTSSQTNMTIDVLGYYSADAVDVNGQGLLYTSLATPVRLLETRQGQAGCFVTGSPLQSGVEQSQLARGTCTIGASAQTIVGNTTVVNNSSSGSLTLWPSNAVRPTIVSFSWTSKNTLNRYFSTDLGTDGKFKIYASKGTDLIVDVSGYFAP